MGIRKIFQEITMKYCWREVFVTGETVGAGVDCINIYTLLFLFDSPKNNEKIFIALIKL